MYLRLNVALLALLLASFGAQAAMEFNPKYYAGAGLAVQKVDIDGYGNGLGLEMTFGADLTETFGAEVELTLPIAKPDDDFGPASDPNLIETELGVSSLAFFGTAFKEIDKQFSVFAKLGLMYRRLDYDSNVGNGSDFTVVQTSGTFVTTTTVEGDDQADLGLTSSVGMLFSIVPKADVRVAFTFVDKNVSYFSVGGRFNF
ncbi:MAG: hypothetical protein COB04_06955 [Gammaproteobacteria bacterium]|nr:MAG: hypothetical protein COB04_06955 [Gammaproteobacteria bacterium]